MSVTQAPWAFDRHTAVDPATGAAQVTPELGGFLGASGGYVAALALRALHAALSGGHRYFFDRRRGHEGMMPNAKKHVRE